MELLLRKNIVDKDDDTFVADNTISVFVKEKDTGSYYEYTETDSLYLNSSVDRVYEIRLNENGYYEIKFGNGVFGSTALTGTTYSPTVGNTSAKFKYNIVPNGCAALSTKGLNQ